MRRINRDCVVAGNCTDMLSVSCSRRYLRGLHLAPVSDPRPGSEAVVSPTHRVGAATPDEKGDQPRMGDSNIEGTPPEGDPKRLLVRTMVATALAAEFVALMSSSPAAAMSAGLLAWTLRVLLEL